MHYPVFFVSFTYLVLSVCDCCVDIASQINKVFYEIYNSLLVFNKLLHLPVFIPGVISIFLVFSLFLIFPLNSPEYFLSAFRVIFNQIK